MLTFPSPRTKTRADLQGVGAAFLYDISYHVLYNGATLRDGDSIGFSEDQVLKVRKGPGVSIDGLTLKIEYPGSVR